MNRRASRRGRLIIGAGAIVALVGLVPRWWTIVRTGAPDLTGAGFEDVGIFVFLAALAMLALIVLPLASRAGESALDRPAAYVALAAVAIGAFLWRVYQISQFGGLGLPTVSPGLWLTGAGLLIVAFGVGDVLTEHSGD
jgi:ABC-type phosphate transport system permease subunit